MEIYKGDLIGQWKRADNGVVYYFISENTLLICTEKKDIAFSYSIETKNRESELIIDKSRFTVIVYRPKILFSLMVKGSVVDFNYLSD